MERFKNICRWLSGPVTLISGYLFVPIACCIPNPMLKITFNHTEHPPNYMESTMGAAIGGLMVSCCGVITCCGCCGHQKPSDL